MLIRNEYPRPQMRRKDWTPLNGEWDFCFDDEDTGLKKGLYTGEGDFDLKINVPFSYQCAASGIGDESDHPIVWYRKRIALDKTDKRTLLCFNGCDWQADVWVNGCHIVRHTGGYAPFSADATDFLKEGENVIVVRCFDPSDPSIPRGKQTWTGERFLCWYAPTTGIWQSVWMETFSDDCIQSLTVETAPESRAVRGDLTSLYGLADEAEFAVSFKGEEVGRFRISLTGKRTHYELYLKELERFGNSFYWSPKTPKLFYADINLYRGGKLIDTVKIRFGMRKVCIDENGKICLNGEPLFQKLVLDQGYWAESGLTPPSAEALKKDIELAMAMGFNGARKHQKLEDPYFYYYAEELGFLTWCEMPSAYEFQENEIASFTKEWQEVVAVARNFTSNICYVPFNESWGIQKVCDDSEQQNFARSIYYLTRALDPSRLVSTNDGWENLDKTDIVSVHDYAADSALFRKKYNGEGYDELHPQGKKLMAEGCLYGGQPLVLTEFGGIAMARDMTKENWGYGDGARNIEEFFARYENLISGICETEFQGFCYTQLTDVQQEVNGLLYPDRTPKVSISRLKEINGKA